MSKILPCEYTVVPHRYEYMKGKGDVTLSGDPIGGRKDLFWDTGEKIDIRWAGTNRCIQGNESTLRMLFCE